MEKRVLPLSEVRASMSGHKMKVSGYAATYETLSRDLPAGNGKVFKERIARRAFDKVLATNPDVVCTFNHNNDAVLGRTTSGTLRLRGDDTGLAFECDLPNTQIGRDVYESVKRGDLNGCSFAFELGERGDEEWSEEEELPALTSQDLSRKRTPPAEEKIQLKEKNPSHLCLLRV